VSGARVFCDLDAATADSHALRVAVGHISLAVRWMGRLQRGVVIRRLRECLSMCHHCGGVKLDVDGGSSSSSEDELDSAEDRLAANLSGGWVTCDH
jgi:hypothetical protein